MVSYPRAVCGSHEVSFLSANRSMVARTALPWTEFGSIASAFLACSVALGLSLSSSAMRARSSWASNSLGSISRAFLARALAIDPNSVQGKAVLATIDLLADKKDTSWDPHTARGYETIGHFFVMNRRYEEGIQYLRKAIELDPQLYSARSKLGINLMRLGQNEEAYQQLELCF